MILRRAALARHYGRRTGRTRPWPWRCRDGPGRAAAEHGGPRRRRALRIRGAAAGGGGGPPVHRGRRHATKADQ